jgi:hypothetical protein
MGPDDFGLDDFVSDDSSFNDFVSEGFGSDDFVSDDCGFDVGDARRGCAGGQHGIRLCTLADSPVSPVTIYWPSLGQIIITSSPLL